MWNGVDCVVMRCVVFVFCCVVLNSKNMIAKNGKSILASRLFVDDGMHSQA